VNTYTFDNETEQTVAKQGVESLQTLALNPVEVKLLHLPPPQKKMGSQEYLSKVIPPMMFRPNSNAFNASIKFFF
jgi:hypothetical protein